MTGKAEHPGGHAPNNHVLRAALYCGVGAARARGLMGFEALFPAALAELDAWAAERPGYRYDRDAARDALRRLAGRPNAAVWTDPKTRIRSVARWIGSAGRLCGRSLWPDLYGLQTGRTSSPLRSRHGTPSSRCCGKTEGPTHGRSGSPMRSRGPQGPRPGRLLSASPKDLATEVAMMRRSDQFSGPWTPHLRVRSARQPRIDASRFVEAFVRSDTSANGEIAKEGIQPAGPLFARMKALVGDVRVDLDAPLPDDEGDGDGEEG